MSELHHDPLVARLRAHVQLATSVFELGEVPTVNPPLRYVVVASSPGDWSRSRYTGGKTALTTTETIYCVGTTNASALKVSSWVEAQMKDYNLVIAGRSVHKPDPWLSRPVIVDKDGLIKLPFATIQFDIYSEPLPV